MHALRAFVIEGHFSVKHACCQRSLKLGHMHGKQSSSAAATTPSQLVIEVHDASAPTTKAPCTLNLMVDLVQPTTAKKLRIGRVGPARFGPPIILSERWYQHERLRECNRYHI